MNRNDIRLAKAALMEKSILGYRTSASRSERTSSAKVGNTKSEAPARLVRTTGAKVGVDKIRA